MFREYAADIKGCIENDQLENAHDILNIYIHNLLDHIAIEDDELFSMAESIFSPKEFENIYFKFQDIDRELGIDYKEDLEKITRELEDGL